MMIQPSSICARCCHYLLGIVVIVSFSSCNVTNSTQTQTEPNAAKISHERRTVTETFGQSQLSVDEPSPSEPVKAVMEVRPAVVAPGSTFELIVKVRIARAHYLHAESGADKTFTPVSINSDLPEGLEPVGEWQLPAPTRIHEGLDGYVDSILLKRTLRVLPIAQQQTVQLTATLQYQACTAELCWPPGDLQLNASFVINSTAR